MKNRFFRTMILAFSAAIALGASLNLDCLGEDDTGEAILDTKKAGSNFPFQGEYVGDVDINGAKVKIGIQVVNRGDGTFYGVANYGGLPGSGWTGSGVRGVGEIKDGVLGFLKGTDTKIKIEKDVATIRNELGDLMGECKKVARKSPTLAQKPPIGAVVLFDGKSDAQFEGGPAKANLLDGDLLVQGVVSKQKFQNFKLHIEFLLPYMPKAKGQARANSGCYCQGRYEVQILDSFGLEGNSNECGAIYGIKKPIVNMCLPPLTWQTYDIEFTAAKFDSEGKKTTNARMTVAQNGTVIHKDVEIPNATAAAKLPESAEPGPIYLQDHGNPIRFRNIWVVEEK